MERTKLLTSLLMLTGITAYAQIGVNTEAPKSTMDVSVKRDGTGVIMDNSKHVGLQAPRISLEELTDNTAVYGTDQKGSLIYINDISGGDSSGQRANINAIGYYFFDGALWQKVVSDNIYTADGTLADDRTLTIGDKSLTFLGSDQYTQWGNFGYFYQQALDSSIYGNASMALIAADKNNDGQRSRMDIQAFPESEGQIFVTGDATGLTIGTHATLNPSSVEIATSSGGSALAEARMLITGQGNIGINENDPTEKLDVAGNVRMRNLPLNGTSNSINTESDGSASPTQNQTFTAVKTLVADSNGVIGFVTGLPSTGSGTAPAGSINIGETISRVYSVPNATATASTFNLKTYVTANGLSALPVIDDLEINLQGVNSSYYDPRIYNVASASKLISYQSFATQVNENETSLNNSVAANGFLQVDANNIVFWTTSAAEVETTNVQVQVDATTYRWYEFKWWCMEVSGEKKIFLSVTRKG